MSVIEKYTCPKCGFVTTLDLSNNVYDKTINCNMCSKEMNVYNKYTPYNATKKQKRVHYLHKSLLN